MSGLSLDRARINVDGAARGNPGPAAIGATIKNHQGLLVACVSQRIGVATNNQAEYAALITALEESLARGAQQVSILSDSELMVRQLNGRYRVKNDGLKPLYSRVITLKRRFTAFSIDYIPREFNSQADRLAKAGIRSGSNQNDGQLPVKNHPDLE